MSMGPSSRRFVAGLIRLGLGVLAIVLVGAFFKRRSARHTHVRLEREAPPPAALAPGDLRIYNADSSVDAILQGDRILAGLSPKTIAKVRHGVDSSTAHDSSQLGRSVSEIVRRSVASAIGTHAVYPLSAIKDIRYEHNGIVIDWKSGGTQDLFGSTTVDGSRVSNSFRREDAERFIQAVRARMAAPEPPQAPRPPAP